MINNQKVGVAIITCNRSDGLEKLYSSLPFEYIDTFIIINDGNPIQSHIIDSKYILNNLENIGVGRSKNRAFEYLKQADVDHYFIFEDDVFIVNKKIFHAYIKASQITGIQHFNSALHTAKNVKNNGDPNPLMALTYPQNTVIALYTACCGVLSYYSKLCIDKVGVMDEQFFNALEHLDHTIRCIKYNMHPPFWYFADIAESNLYLENFYNSEEYKSVILTPHDARSHKIIQDAHNRFTEKYMGVSVKDIKKYNVYYTVNILQRIYDAKSTHESRYSILRKNVNIIFFKQLYLFFPIYSYKVFRKLILFNPNRG